MTNKQTSTEYTGVYTAVFPNKTPREIELEARVKELKEKLKIAEKALNNIHHFDCDTCKKLKFRCKGSCDSKVDKIIEQALQKMEEVK